MGIDLEDFLEQNMFVQEEAYGDWLHGSTDVRVNPQEIFCTLLQDNDVDLDEILSRKKIVTFSTEREPVNSDSVILKYDSDGVYTWALDQEIPNKEFVETIKTIIEKNSFPNSTLYKYPLFICGEIDSRKYEVTIRLEENRNKFSKLELQIGAENFTDIKTPFRDFLFSLWSSTCKFRDNMSYKQLVEKAPYSYYQKLRSKKVSLDLDGVPF